MELKAILESLIFASDKPLTVKQLRALVGGAKGDDVKAALDDIEAEFRQSGVQLAEVGGGYQFRTHPDCAPFVKKLLVGRPPRLTQAMLETLAIVAYRQPITRPEIEDIRGVDCGGVLRLLLDRMLIRMLGKKEEVGRPILYGTTKQFLEFFNLKDLTQLPTLREFTEATEEMTGRLDPDDAALIAGGEDDAEQAGPAAEAAHSGPAAPAEAEQTQRADPDAPAEADGAAPSVEARAADTAAPEADASLPEGEPPVEAPARPVEDAPLAAARPAEGAEAGPQTWARATAVTPDDAAEDEAISSLDEAMSRVDDILRAQRQQERERLRALVGETAAAAAEAAAAAAELQTGVPGEDSAGEPADPDEPAPGAGD